MCVAHSLSGLLSFSSETQMSLWPPERAWHPVRRLQALLCEQCVPQGFDREPLVIALLAQLPCRRHHQIAPRVLGTGFPLLLFPSFFCFPPLVSVQRGPVCDVSGRTLHPRCAKAETSAEAREDDGWIARRSSPHDVLELLHLHSWVRKKMSLDQTGHPPSLSAHRAGHHVRVTSSRCFTQVLLSINLSRTSALPNLCISPVTHGRHSVAEAAEARPGGFGFGARPHTS